MTEGTRDGWPEVLAALDRNPPILFGAAARHWSAGLLAELLAADLLRELPPARSRACTECADAPFRDIVYTESSTGHPRALFACPQCGLYEIPLEDLRRWQIERQALATWIGRSLGATGQVAETVPGRLWRLGRLRRDATNWSLWLGVPPGRRDLGGWLAAVPPSPRTLLLVPGRRPAVATGTSLVTGSLRDLTTWAGGELLWDEEGLADLLVSSVAPVPAAKKPAPTRRQTRAADIEALVGELKQHLRAARDHAFHTRDTRGVPVLLPRPTQKDLARRLEITESRVSRSLNDAQAHQLQLLWNLADDLEGVLRFG